MEDVTQDYEGVGAYDFNWNYETFHNPIFVEITQRYVFRPSYSPDHVSYDYLPQLADHESWS